jgi:heme oxygenase (biliverdin-IX-beta and delta-forming)
MPRTHTSNGASVVPITARSQLRAATQSLHARVETRLDLASPTVTLRTYTEALRSLLWAYSALEDGLEPHICALAQMGIGVPIQRRARRIRRDLAVLGVEISNRSVVAAPEVDGVAAALGSMYVMEGAALGGAVIRRNVLSVLKIDVDSGGSFFAGDGEDIGARWKAFCIGLEIGLRDASLVRRAVDSAVATFALIDACLHETRL